MEVSTEPVTVIQPQAAPSDSFTCPEFEFFLNPSENTRNSKDSVLCTACGARKNVCNDILYEHPVLEVLVCEPCHLFYHRGSFAKDSEGMDEQCRWCGQGGNLLMCDFCSNTFCNSCIKRNFSPEVFNRIRDEEVWKCFVCESSRLQSKVKYCEEVLQKREARMKESQPPENSQEIVLNTLTEGNKCLDDLLGTMENPGGKNHQIKTVHMKTEPGETFPASISQFFRDGSKKVPPVTILREKESYVIQQRSTSCDESANIKVKSKRQSDPENQAMKLKRAVGCQASLNHDIGHKILTENDLNVANVFETISIKESIATPNEEDKQKPEYLTKEPERAPPGPDRAQHTCARPDLSPPGPERTSGPERTLPRPKHTSPGPEHTSAGPDLSPPGPERTSGPEHTSPGPEHTPPGRTPPNNIDVSFDSTNNPVLVRRRNVGRRTGHKARLESARNIAEPEELPGVPKHEMATKSESKNSDVQFNLSFKVKEAEHLIVRFIRIYKELMASQASQDILNTIDVSQSPSQYSRFRTTSMLLSNVKKASSRLIRMEHDLRAQKTQLGTFRELTDSDISLSSSEDEMFSEGWGNRAKKRRKIMNFIDGANQESKLEKKALNYEAQPNQSLPSEAQPSTSANNYPSASVPTESKNAIVVLKKLSQEDIDRLSQGGKKNDNDSESLDTDISKNLQPDDESHATTLGEEPSPMVTNFENKILKKSDEKRRGQRHEEGSDYEMESYSSFSSGRSEFDPDENLHTEISDHEINDNDIAMNMLLQKMQEQGGDESDSDVEKLCDKDDGSKNKEDNLEKKNSEEAFNDQMSYADESVTSDKNFCTHPLLRKRWKSSSNDEGDDDKPMAKEREKLVNGKRKRSSHDQEVGTSKIRNEMNGVEHSDSDSNLTTDSETNVPVKIRKLNETNQEKKIFNSDSDADCVIVSDDGTKKETKVNGDEEDDSSSSVDDTDTDVPEETKKKLFKKKRYRLIANSDSEQQDTIVEPGEETEEDTPQKKGRKNIRKIIDDEALSHSTQTASKEEMQRRKRVSEERELEEEKEEVIIVDEENNTKLKKTVIVGLKLSKDPSVEVHHHLVKHLKPHQIEGIQFLWDNIIEKVKDANTKHGNGCILAHCMGLGKTLQTVAFLHTVLMSKHLPKLRTALVLCPVGVVNNWLAEFNKWLPKFNNSEYKFQKLRVMELNSARNEKDRVNRLAYWQNHGGVLVMGYGLFRAILSDKKHQTLKSKEHLIGLLCVPGADILVCDEGHILKNAMSQIATIVQEVQTRRRIVLTGTPLQNNMIEYHCMVSIVKPKLLGSLKEFKNGFVNPIENGQHVDSTPADVELMKKRAHVLHELLSGCVQRKDYSCFQVHLHLPPKQEYTLKVRLSDLQIRLYEKYLAMHNSADVKLKRASLFKDFHKLLLIVCHPRCLIMAKEKKVGRDNPMEDEGDSESEEEDLSSDDSVIDIRASQVPKPTCLDDIYALSGCKLRLFIEDKCGKKMETRSRKKLINLAVKYHDENFCKTVEFEESLKKKSVPHLKTMITEHGGSFIGCTEKMELINLVKTLVLKQTQADQEWYEQFMPAQEKLSNVNEHSGKIMIMLEILQGAAKLCDKVVIFSQSLMVLDLIEEVLKAEMKAMSKGLKPCTEPFAQWLRNKDYYRLDGSTPGNVREQRISWFNDKSNARGRLFLISTRAGGIGINLVGANRVIVFDVSWNPTHDTQSIFRIYRFGQTKPCFIYRLVAQGTMEEKIYERQVVKRSLAFRVVDEQQIVRHFTSADIAELYTFKPAPKTDNKKIPDMLPPQDAILASILLSSNNVVSYHEPDVLLDHQVSEELTEAEQRAAWAEYDFENTKAQSISSSCKNHINSLETNVLYSLFRKGDDMVRTLSQKISEITSKSLPTLMLEIQMNDQCINPEDAMQKAVQQKLDQHVMLRRLSRLKAKLMKYKTEVELIYQARVYSTGNVLPASSNTQVPSTKQTSDTSEPPTSSVFSSNLANDRPHNPPYTHAMPPRPQAAPHTNYRQPRPTAQQSATPRPRPTVPPMPPPSQGYRQHSRMSYT